MQPTSWLCFIAVCRIAQCRILARLRATFFFFVKVPNSKKKLLTFRDFWGKLLVSLNNDAPKGADPQEPLKMNNLKTKKIIKQEQSKVNSSSKKNYITDTGEVLIDKTKKGKKYDWAGRKQGSLKIAELFAKAREKNPAIISPISLQRIQECSDVLIFKENLDTGERKLNQIYTCKNKFCPQCSHRKGLLMYSQMFRVMEKVFEQYPDAAPILLTFTTKNVAAPDIGKEVDRYTRTFSKIFSDKRGLPEGKKFRKSLLGTQRTVETSLNYKAVKAGQDNVFHVHMHVLAIMNGSYFEHDNYLTQKEFQELWKVAAGLDYDPIVDVRRIKGKGKNLKSAICEVSKYPVKPLNFSKLSEEQSVDILSALQIGLFNRRLVSYTGIIRKIRAELKLEDIEKADLLKVGDEEEEEEDARFECHVFRWSHSMKEYVCAPYQLVKSLDEEYFRERLRQKLLKEYGLVRLVG